VMLLLPVSISLGFAATLMAPAMQRSAVDLPVPLREDAATDVPEVLPDLIDRLREAHALAPEVEDRALQQRALLEQLSAFEWRRVALELRQRAGPLESDGMREVLLIILERLGTDDELALAVSLGTANAGEPWVSLLEQCVLSIIGREPASITKLERLIILADPEIALVLSRAVAHSHAPGAMELLAGILGRNPGIELPILGLIVSAAGGEPRPLPASVCEPVRAYLWSKDAQLRREAAQAVAKLGDFSSTDALIEMLQAEEKSVRGAAHWSLRELCGMDFSGDQQRWGLWLQNEKAWFETESEMSLGCLNGAGERSVIRALDVLRAHHYQRFAIANSVSPLLTHNVQTVRMKACDVLKELTPKREHTLHDDCPLSAPSSPESPTKVAAKSTADVE
jgi:hypothetical protein